MLGEPEAGGLGGAQGEAERIGAFAGDGVCVGGAGGGDEDGHGRGRLLAALLLATLRVGLL